MKRGFAALLLVSLGTLTADHAVFAEGASVTFSPAAIGIDGAGRFETDVVVSTDTFTRGIQFGLKYDASLIHIDRITDGTFYQSWAAAHNAQAGTVIRFNPDNTTGHVSIGGMAIFGGPDDGPVGSGPVLHIVGSAAAGASGTATIEFESLLVSGMAVAIKPLAAGTASIGIGEAPAVRPQVEPVPTRVHDPQPAIPADVDVRNLKGGSFDPLLEAVSPIRPYLPVAILVAGVCVMAIVYRGISSIPIRDVVDKPK